MKNPGLPDALWGTLDGGLWHATKATAVSSIALSGGIQVSEKKRYVNSFCQSLDAICLFDFGPTAIDDWGQFNNWHGWFGHQQDVRVPVWLKINRDVTKDGLIDACSSHALWRDNVSRTFIPGVEACHKGPIHIEAISRILLIDHHQLEKFKVVTPDWKNFLSEIAEFEASLPPPPPENPLVTILREANEKKEAK